jgi:hypothetical protein
MVKVRRFQMAFNVFPSYSLHTGPAVSFRRCGDARWCIIAVALLTAACGSTSTETATSPTPVKCAVSLSAAEQSIGALGGAATVKVTTGPECAWTSAAEVSWIDSVAPTSGQGSGDVQFQVSPNPDRTVRQGAIAINGQRAMVRQDGTACRFALALSPEQFGANGGNGTIEISAPGGCGWTASASHDWIILASSAGTGTASVSFAVTTNTGGSRSATVAIGGETVSVTQDAAAQSLPAPGQNPPPSAPCTASIQPTSVSTIASGGSGLIALTTNIGCAWGARSLVPWIAIATGASGTGSATVAFTVAPNSGTTRTGALDVAGLLFTVIQAGSSGVTCSPAITPTNQSISAAGATGNVAVSASAGCAWTAISNAAWLTITGGTSGAGDGTVVFSVAANSGVGRTGTVTIAGQTFSVTQAAGCSYSINPVTYAIGAAGGAGPPIAVSTDPGCAWSAASNAAWLTISSGVTGSGSGTVAFTVAPNTGSARTGTLTIAGRVLTLSQGGTCTYSISPTSQTIGTEGGAGLPVAVSTASDCAWTATSNAGWLTITSGTSGNGNGTTLFTVAGFGGNTRTGTLTIAGQPFTITQTRCSPSIDPHSQTVSAAGGQVTASVSAAQGCSWTATSNATWIVVTSGASGTGSATVRFSVLPNAGSARTGTLTIAAQTFTTNQAGVLSDGSRADRVDAGQERAVEHEQQPIGQAVWYEARRR